MQTSVKKLLLDQETLMNLNFPETNQLLSEMTNTTKVRCIPSGPQCTAHC